MIDRSPPRRPLVLSLEQALSMSYATLRLVHLGYRVIRIENAGTGQRTSRGDPNRYIGREVAGPDRHSYYVAPNVGKEAIAIDLKSPRGQALLRQLVVELEADVFCTNTLPARHPELGIDYTTLSAARSDLIWCCISAMGLRYPDVPGYDPVMQALCGYMDLTGMSHGPPLQSGLPLSDLKAGDEAFVQILAALFERSRTGEGRAIDISMAQVAVSWLQTFLPMLDMGSQPTELKRAGNEHRQFIPVNAYQTSDGFIYVAVGSNVQWERLTRTPMFAELADPCFATNESRRTHRLRLHERIGEVTRRHTSQEISAVLQDAAIPHAPITPIEDVMDLPFVRETLLKTIAPDGRTIRLPPPAVATPFLTQRQGVLDFAPAYGEHTGAVLREAGVQEDEIAALFREGVVAGPVSPPGIPD